jgi:hypothetical protein
VTSFYLGFAAHTPRVTCDRLVLARETWRLDRAALSPMLAADETERFLAQREIALRHRLPRHVFVRIPGERKPWYTDLESPLFAELLAKLARALPADGADTAEDQVMRITEMLPGPGDAWLPDAAGRRYTSELRIACLDPAEWRPAGEGASEEAARVE